MNLDVLTTSLESAVEAQVRFATDSAVREAAHAVVEALGPALRDAGLQLARQAAEEVQAQLADRSVEVVLDGDDPTIRVGASDGRDDDVDAGDLDARITLRLPSGLKDLVEEAALGKGDSVNTWVVKTLSTNARSKQRGTNVSGSFDL